MDMSGIGSAARKAAGFWRMAPALLAVAALGACGKSTTGPSGPQRTVIGTQTGTMQSFSAGAHPVQAGSSGTMDVTLDWGNAANDFDIFVTSNNCNTSSLADLEAGVGSCSHITSAQSSNLKPERVTWAGTGGTTYKVWVANFGLSADSYTVTAGVTN
jgi:hypothetical protein